MTASAPAGYYDDGAGRLRYWNGEAWTDNFQALPSTPESHGDPKAWAAQAKADKKAASAAAKEEKRAQAAKLRAAKEAQKQAELAAFRQRAGNLVKSGSFGGKSVEIYDKGFVRVGFIITSNTPLEELRSISYRRNSRDKGSGGRALGAIATGGLNLLASGEKVEAFLSIATSAKVHQLSSSQAMSWEEKAGMALEAAGQSVIDMKRHAAPVPAVSPRNDPPAPTQKSVAEKIRELAALHADGILSDEEFASAKATLLSQM